MTRTVFFTVEWNWGKPTAYADGAYYKTCEAAAEAARLYQSEGLCVTVDCEEIPEEAFESMGETEITRDPDGCVGW
jgi:hypothetical protein